MAAPITQTVPANGSVDVGIDGPAARRLGVGPTEIAPPRLHLVRELSAATEILQKSAARFLNLTIPVRNSNHARLPQ